MVINQLQVMTVYQNGVVYGLINIAMEIEGLVLWDIYIGYQLELQSQLTIWLYHSLKE